MHDPRIGRFFAVDPLASKYPHYTPYSFSGNKVIANVELEGLETGPSASNSTNSDATTLENPGLNNPFKGNNGLNNASVANGLGSNNQVSNSGNSLLLNKSNSTSGSSMSDKYKIPRHNESKSSFTFTIGTQPWMKRPDPDGDPSTGKPMQWATSGTVPYNTAIRFKNFWTELSETNHQFGIEYEFRNSNFSAGVLYSKQKIRGDDNVAGNFNYEAPAGLNYFGSYRFGISTKDGDLSVGISPELGLGQAIATLRADGYKGRIKNVGMSTSFNIKVDISFKQFEIYGRGMSTYYYIAPQTVPVYGVQLRKAYGIAAFVVGIGYKIQANK
jgi:hypothetical protein